MPFSSHGPGSVDQLFKVVAPEQRIHCVLEPTGRADSFSGYLLKYEHLNQYVPLLRVRKRPGKIINTNFVIEPAFICSPETSSPGERKFWAAKVCEPTHTINHESHQLPRRRKSIIRRVRSSFRPGHSHRIIDVSQQQQAAVRSPSPAAVKVELPILAEIDGNCITNRYQFCTASPLFQDGSLGTLSIRTSYVKCKPRRLNIVLSNRDTVAAGGSLDEEQVTLQSKKPDWNQRYQIYELDFGGRVNRDSIKNFQVESNGQVVSPRSVNHNLGV